MPFTLSHAAAVLPALHRTGAARGPLVASALVAGSFAPDMTYFADTLVPGAMLFGTFTHSPIGVLTVDVPIAAALVGGWLLLREPLLALLPRPWQGRAYALARGRAWHPRGTRELALLAAWFCLSAILGSVTHILWDAFTHPGRWGTRLVPGLEATVNGLPVYTYLQYGTSALAMVAIGWFLWSALRTGEAGPAGRTGSATAGGSSVAAPGAGGGAARAAGWTPPEAVPLLTLRQKLLLTALLALCLLGSAVHRTVRAHAVYGSAATWFDYIPTVLFGAGAGLALGLPVYAVAVRLLHRRARPATGPAPGRTETPEREAGAESDMAAESGTGAARESAPATDAVAGR
ncbi:DUF4184 family protein [Streptomyces sp. Pv4-95]|uniref:DUF4184 family protein n=1 Tax=Streptomyces sp. Pv4-95 TaxID=3049543 RepID=UPI0038919BAB